MNLSDCPMRSNNLQLLRFLASILVIVSHAFALSTGSNAEEWLIKCTNYQLTLGGLAVSVFFCAGGFLIARSMERVKNGPIYFKTRILRIFPLLAVVVFITAFILGPCITQDALGDYFTNPNVYKYLSNALFILQHDLPGIFLNNVYGSTVNGSLWTLPVEFLCYIGCYIMWKLNFFDNKNTKFSIPLVAIGSIALFFFVNFTGLEILLSALLPILLFYTGILFYLYRNRINLTGKGAILCIILLIFSNYLNLLNIGMIFFFPYILFYLSFAIKQISDRIGKLGNYSYGIYLCAFPIQQVIVEYFGGHMNPIHNMILSIPLAILCGYVLYILIEEPISRLGKKYL